jgi:hypothetical protein
VEAHLPEEIFVGSEVNTQGGMSQCIVFCFQQLNTHQKNTSTVYVAEMTRRKSTESEVKEVLVFKQKKTTTTKSNVCSTEK